MAYTVVSNSRNVFPALEGNSPDPCPVVGQGTRKIFKILLVGGKTKMRWIAAPLVSALMVNLVPIFDLAHRKRI